MQVPPRFTRSGAAGSRRMSSLEWPSELEIGHRKLVVEHSGEKREKKPRFEVQV
jgi:hypothetical protein